MTKAMQILKMLELVDLAAKTTTEGDQFLKVREFYCCVWQFFNTSQVSYVNKVRNLLEILDEMIKTAGH